MANEPDDGHAHQLNTEQTPAVGLITERLVRDDLVLFVNCRKGHPTVVFLHGLAGYGGEWLPVISHLVRSIGLVIPDQRGHGKSRSEGSISVERVDLVGDVVAAIESFAASSPVVLVGQSMGGVVATYVAGYRPDLVSSLVLIEAGMEAISEQQLNRLSQWFDSWSAGFRNESEAREFFDEDAPSTQAWVQGLENREGRLKGRFDQAQMVDLMRSLEAEPGWAEWAKIAADRVLVTASSSNLPDAEVERMLELAPETKHIKVSDSGHDVHLDQPEAVAAIIGQVLNKTGRNPTRH
jgi:pimeloyl-ACP methyl ester carboxylesterase